MVLYYNEKTIIFITGLHNKPQGCGASVAAAAEPFTTKKKLFPLTALTGTQSVSCVAGTEPFIAAPSTAALLHRKPASTATSHESYGARDSYKRNAWRLK
jgi:hypothetical protein